MASPRGEARSSLRRRWRKARRLSRSAAKSAAPEMRRLPVLRIENLASRYGRIEVLHGISLEVEAGEIVTLVGARDR